MDGFWQNGIAIESMANAMKYGNHSRYLSVVKVQRTKPSLFDSGKLSIERILHPLHPSLKVQQIFLLYIKKFEQSSKTFDSHPKHLIVIQNI
jgi:hypothetical protein